MPIDVNALAAFTGLLTVSISVIGLWVSIIAFWVENRRSRFALSVDIVLKLDDRFNSEQMRGIRRKAAQALRSQTNEKDTDEVLGFLSTLGILLREHAIHERIVWQMFFYWIHGYCNAAKNYIESQRKNDPTVWNVLGTLYKRVAKIQQKNQPGWKANTPMSQKEMDDFLREEANLPQGH